MLQETNLVSFVRLIFENLRSIPVKLGKLHIDLAFLTATYKSFKYFRVVQSPLFEQKVFLALKVSLVLGKVIAFTVCNNSHQLDVIKHVDTFLIYIPDQVFFNELDSLCNQLAATF